MPPGNPSQALNAIRSLHQGSCCFCHRPEDPAVPGNLACLCLTSEEVIIHTTNQRSDIIRRASPLQFHEACAGYSYSVARTDWAGHNTIVDWQVLGEWDRGTNCTCSLCGDRGATLLCIAGTECGACFHFPCARAAAMQQKSSNEDITDNNCQPPVFSRSSRQVACHKHKYLIKEPLIEPAGLWLEAIGGWSQHSEEAKSHWARHGAVDYATTTTTLTKPVVVTGQLTQGAGIPAAAGGGAMNTTSSYSDREQAPSSTLIEETVAVVAPSLALPDDNNRVVDEGDVDVNLISSDSEVDAYDFEETFHIKGYNWPLQANVDGSYPPLRKGEVRVLGVTLSPPVAKACQAVMSNFLAAEETSHGDLRQVVPMFPLRDDRFAAFRKGNKKKIEPLDLVAKRIEDMILRQAKRMGSAPKGATSLSEVGQLPVDLPVSPLIEVFDISKDDPRRGLASEEGSQGVRVKHDLATAKSLPPGTVLGIYGGLQLFRKDLDRLLADHRLARKCNISTADLQLKVDSYVGDEDQVLFAPLTEQDFADRPEGDYPWAIPEAFFARDLLESQMKSASWLVTSAYFYGNITCIINDGCLNPFHSYDPGAQTVLKANCTMMQVLLRGWPFIALVTTAKVNPGDELVYNYGQEYWETIKTNIRHRDQVEHSLQAAAVERRKREELERELAKARELLKTANSTGSGLLPGALESGGGLALVGCGDLSVRQLDSMGSGIQDPVPPKTHSGVEGGGAAGRLELLQQQEQQQVQQEEEEEEERMKDQLAVEQEVIEEVEKEKEEELQGGRGDVTEALIPLPAAVGGRTDVDDGTKVIQAPQQKVSQGLVLNERLASDAATALKEAESPMSRGGEGVVPDDNNNNNPGSSDMENDLIDLPAVRVAPLDNGAPAIAITAGSEEGELEEKVQEVVQPSTQPVSSSSPPPPPPRHTQPPSSSDAAAANDKKKAEVSSDVSRRRTDDRPPHSHRHRHHEETHKTQRSSSIKSGENGKTKLPHQPSSSSLDKHRDRNKGHRDVSRDHPSHSKPSSSRVPPAARGHSTHSSREAERNERERPGSASTHRSRPVDYGRTSPSKKRPRSVEPPVPPHDTKRGQHSSLTKEKDCSPPPGFTPHGPSRGTTKQYKRADDTKSRRQKEEEDYHLSRKSSRAEPSGAHLTIDNTPTKRRRRSRSRSRSPHHQQQQQQRHKSEHSHSSYSDKNKRDTSDRDYQQQKKEQERAGKSRRESFEMQVALARQAHATGPRKPTIVFPSVIIPSAMKLDEDGNSTVTIKGKVPSENATKKKDGGCSTPDVATGVFITVDNSQQQQERQSTPDIFSIMR